MRVRARSTNASGGLVEIAEVCGRRAADDVIAVMAPNRVKLVTAIPEELLQHLRRPQARYKLPLAIDLESAYLPLLC